MSKASKRRLCPVVAHEITAAECGENRGSRYACPAGCLYSPLAPANYSHLLDLEDGVDKKCMELLREEARKSPALDKALQKAYSDHSAHAVHAFYEWQLFFRRDADGLTLTGKRLRAADLKNDERVLLRAKMRTRVALLEVLQILDHQQIEAVDLLSAGPKPFLLQDRSLARVATRFSTALVWIYPLPHYWRLSGTAILIPEFALFDADEIVKEITRHLGGPTTEIEMRLWLAEHFVQFEEALHATAQRRRLQMFANMDAQFGKAVYELRASFGECRDKLDDIVEIESDRLTPTERDEGFAEARVWFSDDDSMVGSARPALGRILLGQSHVRLEAIGAERLARLRHQFEAQMGQRARFTGELRDDMGARLAGEGPKINESLVPPRLLEQPQQIVLTSSRISAPAPGKSKEDLEKDWFAEQDRAFLDNSIPALDGHTPREAARDPALRAKLLRLMKQRVRAQDEHNLDTGESNDINWMLRELGLVEIIFTAPPIRPPPVQKNPETECPEDLREGEEDFIDDTIFPPAPPLPKKAFTMDEAADRLDSMLDEFATAAEALDELEACGSIWIDDARSVIGDLVNDREFDLAVVSLVQARLALVPPGHREPVLDFDELVDAFAFEMEKFVKALQSPTPRGLMQLFEKSRQPALTQMIVLEFIEAMSKLPKKDQPRPEAQPILAVFLKVMIDELDRTLRG